MAVRDLYDSGAIEVLDGQGEEFQVTVHAGETAMWEQSATATLTFGTGTMFCFATLGEDDLRRIARELVQAASVIRNYEKGEPVVEAHRPNGRPNLTVVSET